MRTELLRSTWLWEDRAPAPEQEELELCTQRSWLCSEVTRAHTETAHAKVPSSLSLHLCHLTARLDVEEAARYKNQKDRLNMVDQLVSGSLGSGVGRRPSKQWA